MKAGDLMSRNPITVRMDQPFSEAFRLLVANRANNLPIVDGDGVCKGNFPLRDVWEILLPKAVQLDRKSLEDLSFVSTSIEKLKDLVADAADLPASRFVNGHDAPVVYTDTPIMQAMLLFDEFGQTLAVVDRKSGKVAGTLSAWEILDPLAG
jgi:predicted transcriptional regulator